MENLRKLIVETYLRNPKASYSEIGRITGKCPSTVRRVILRFKELKTVVRQPGCGRKPGAVDKKMEKKVLALFQEQPCLSVRDVGKMLGISKSLVHRIKENNGLITYKAQAAPHRTDKQRQSAKTRSRNLSDRFLQKWANDPRNIHRNDEEDDDPNRILEETEIKIESEQISYVNDSEIFFMPKTEPTTTRPLTFTEVPHITENIALKNGYIDKESSIVKNEIVPDTSEILEALRHKNEENIKLQNTNEQLRNEIKRLKLQLQRKNKTISTLKAKLKKDKANKNTETILSSRESTEFSTEGFEDLNELEE